MIILGSLPAAAKNRLNLYAGYGLMNSAPIVPSQTVSSGLGNSLAALLDFATVGPVSWELGLLLLNRKFQVQGIEKDWSYFQIAPLVRYYFIPETLSGGMALYYATRSTTDTGYKGSELGGLLSARVELDIFPSQVFGVGAFLEGRAQAGVGLGSGTGIVHLDFLGLLGLRFGFL